MKKYFITHSAICRIFILLGLIGSVKISEAQNPIIKHIFTADPAPLVYHDTLFYTPGTIVRLKKHLII